MVRVSCTYRELELRVGEVYKAMKLMIDRHDVALIVVALLKDVVHLERWMQDFELFFFRDGDVAAASFERERADIRISSCLYDGTSGLLTREQGMPVLMDLLHPGLVPEHFSVMIDEVRSETGGVAKNDGLSWDLSWRWARALAHRRSSKSSNQKWGYAYALAQSFCRRPHLCRQVSLYSTSEPR